MAFQCTGETQLPKIDRHPKGEVGSDQLEGKVDSYPSFSLRLARNRALPVTLVSVPRRQSSNFVETTQWVRTVGAPA